MSGVSAIGSVGSADVSISVQRSASASKASAPTRAEQVKQNTAAASRRADETKQADQRAQKSEAYVKEKSDHGDELEMSRKAMANAKAGGEIVSASADGMAIKRPDPADGKAVMQAQQKSSQEAMAKRKENAEKALEAAEAKKELYAEHMGIEKPSVGPAKAEEQTAEDGGKQGGSVSLNGKTKEQVAQLYRDGEISRFQYEQDVKRREEGAENNAKAKENEENMTKMAAAKERFDIEDKAVQDAAENGRSDIIGSAIGITKG